MLLKKKQEKIAFIPTSALPDIVFLLLIFFLVTTTIDTEKGLGLVLPDQEIDPVDPVNISCILINQEGEILFDKNLIEIHNITGIVKEKVNANPKLIISVMSDRKIKYDLYVDVLDRLKKGGARKISIAEPEDY